MAVFILLLPCLLLRGQLDFSLIEQHIIEDYRILERAYKNENPERQQIFGEKLKRQILFALLQEGSYYYPFNRLKRYLIIVESKDKKIRIFSWNGLLQGVWQKSYSIAQFRGAGNMSYFRILSNGEQNVDDYEDVCVESIDLIKDPTQQKEYYILIGRGSHFIGQEHVTARICYLAHNELVDCETCFETGKSWTVKGTANFPINLSYDAKRHQLHYLEPTYDQLTGNRRQGLYHRMYWINGLFKKDNVN